MKRQNLRAPKKKAVLYISSGGIQALIALPCAGFFFALIWASIGGLSGGFYARNSPDVSAPEQHGERSDGDGRGRRTQGNTTYGDACDAHVYSASPPCCVDHRLNAAC